VPRISVERREVMDVCRCARCGYEQPAPQPLGHGLRAVCVCPRCLCLIVREMGEMTGPEERADPEDWGNAWH
jgi:hypothetical protein